MDDAFTVLRVVNAFFGSLLLCAVCYKSRLYLASYDMHQKLVTISYGLFALAVSYGSIEAINVDSPPGIRVLLVTAAIAVGVYAFIRYPDSAFKVTDESSLR